MGTAHRTDAWSVEQTRPLTEPALRAIGAEPGADGLAGYASSPDASSSASSSSSGRATTGADVVAWIEAAFGPALAGFGRELGGAVRRLRQPMKLERPWLWIGAAGLVGYALGRTGALRPLVSFTMRTALNTLVERALRGG